MRARSRRVGENGLWSLRSDLFWAHALLWMAQSGRGGREPKRGVHLYLASRYGRLAEYYAARGAHAKARRLERLFAYHHRAGGDGGTDPVAASMAMPVPRVPPEDAVAPGADGGHDAA